MGPWLLSASLVPAHAAPPPAIVNGAVEPGYPSVVALGAAGFTICTGNVVTPRIVLTAAHCQADLPFDLVVAIGSAYVGTDPLAPDAELKFESAAVHPDYHELSGNFLGENDVGVLVLTEDAPVEPVFFRTRPLEKRQAVHEVVTSVGFGLDEDGEAGIKRSAPLVVSDLDPTFVLADSADNDAGANICSGDSGGPQFHEEPGLIEQWSVHSWGDTRCLVTSGSTRTDHVSDWLLEQVQAVHGTTDFCEITDRYGDGTCDPTCERVDPDCVTSFADLVAMGGPGGCDTAPGAGAGAAAAAAAVLCRRAGRRKRMDG